MDPMQKRFEFLKTQEAEETLEVQESYELGMMRSLFFKDDKIGPRFDPDYDYPNWDDYADMVNIRNAAGRMLHNAEELLVHHYGKDWAEADEGTQEYTPEEDDFYESPDMCTEV